MIDLIRDLSKNANPGYIKNYKNFIPGKDTVLYAGPYWDNKEIEAMLTVLLTGNWIVTGEYVKEFQESFAKMFNVNYSHMVNSGSSANLVMIAGLKKYFNWKDDDEIIVSPVGFPTTISPLIQNNLRPIFVDIEFDTLNFNVDLIKEKITSKTVAIFVSPVLGNPPDLDKITKICNEYGLLLIGDSCDSLGSKYKGKHLGEYYTSWTTSFYPAHHISTGEGGMISTNEEELHNLFRSISWWGRDCYCVGANNLIQCGTCGKRFDFWLPDYDGVIDHKYVFTNLGYNLKPLDFQGAVGSVQLTKIEEIDFKRRNNKQFIEKTLVEKIGIKPVKVIEGSDPSWFGVPVVCNSQEQKELLVAHFESFKIQTRPYFAGNILLHKPYKHLDNYLDFPNSNKALSHVFFLGCTPLYTESVLEYIQMVINKW